MKCPKQKMEKTTKSIHISYIYITKYIHKSSLYVHYFTIPYIFNCPVVKVNKRQKYVRNSRAGIINSLPFT